jgi:lysozyme
MALSSIIIDLNHDNAVTANGFHKAYDESGIRLVIHKVSQGADFTDPLYTTRRDNVRLHLPQLAFGGYHWLTGHSLNKQVSRFFKNYDGERILMVDWEDTPTRWGGTASVALAEDFVGAVNKKTGLWPILYTGELAKRPYVNRQIKKDSPLLLCPLNIAQYGPKPELPRGWKTFFCWQYTDGLIGPQPRLVSGVSGCDRAKYNGTPAQFKDWLESIDYEA